MSTTAKSIIIYLKLIYLVFLFQSTHNIALATPPTQTSSSQVLALNLEESTFRPLTLKEKKLPKMIQNLLRAYPQHLKSADQSQALQGHLYWYKGSKSKWTLSKTHYDLSSWQKLSSADQASIWKGRPFETVLNQATLAEQLLQIYPQNTSLPTSLPLNFEPGRLRDEAFFKRIYGSTKKEVYQTLRTINWGKQKLKVTTLYRIDKRLEAIYNELKKLPRRFKKYYEPSAGAFHWRMIKGTSRLSVHSFGAAIDIGVKYSNYWKWTLKVYGKDKKGMIPYKNKFPQEIIRIFERHGFIWGGWWYHHDSMHFEFRPELLLAQPPSLEQKSTP